MDYIEYQILAYIGHELIGDFRTGSHAVMDSIAAKHVRLGHYVEIIPTLKKA